MVITGLLIVLSSITYAQPVWFQQQSGTFGPLSSIYFTGPETGYTAGDNGVMLKTTDGGEDWVPMTSGVNSPLKGISFGDADNGTACGYSGVILRTTDAGGRWDVIQDGWMISYYSAFQLDANYSFVAGVNTIFQPFLTKTTNGWASMQNYNFYIQWGASGYEGDLRDICFLNSQHGFAAAKIFNGQGAIVETVNGGQSWTTVQWSDNALLSIDFADNQNGMAVGQNGWIYKTSNGGRDWTLMQSGTTYNLNGVCYVNADNAWTAGDDGIILHTSNGGTSWEVEEPNAFTDFNEVHFYDMDHGYIAGNNGVILKRGTPQIIDATVTLTPESVPVVIPASGGEFNFNIEVANNEPTVINLDVWTMVTFPNGMLYGPIIFANVNLQPNSSVSRARVQAVPASAMPGTYFYIAYIGDYPLGEIAEDFFEVEKLVGENSGTQNNEWMNWGESFAEMNDPSVIVQPENISLITAYPNPFNPTTEISFSLNREARISLKIYDISGREVAALAKGYYFAGEFSVTFDGSNLSSGVYFAVLETENNRNSTKLLLIK